MDTTLQLFRCLNCNRVDMRDLAVSEAIRLGKPVKNFHCTVCLTGHWHGQFPHEAYDPAKDEVVNPPFPPSCC
jgi:hypothetical protein